MKSLELATDLRSNETNVKVNSFDELTKMIKLVGKSNIYMLMPWGWETVSEFEHTGGTLNELF